MNRFTLLIFLTSWSSVVPLSLQCETGIAHPGSVLSMFHSNMANADVALLITYQAEDVNACMKDCCTEKYGSCTVVSFKQNVSENSCQHFNCRPVMKCKYVSSKLTDSFSFSSSPLPAVPSKHASRMNSSSTVSSAPTQAKLDEHIIKEQELGVTKEEVATYSEEQFAMKNDNTTIKPRKGVDEFANSSENAARSSIKPRKGVTLNDEIPNYSKSNVKPRKGVGSFTSETVSTTTLNELSTNSIYFSKKEHSSSPVSINTYNDTTPNDLIFDLEKVFEDDPEVKDIKPTSSPTFSIVKSIDSSPTFSSSVDQTSTISYTIPQVQYSTQSLTTDENFTHDLQSSFSTSLNPSNPMLTPHLQTTTTTKFTETVNYTSSLSSSPSIFEHSKLIFDEVSAEVSTELTDNEESEKERKYTSSMHLVLSLVFGLLVLFTVMGVIAKRVYDGWIRRHYRRMDFLIDGMYNGY